MDESTREIRNTVYPVQITEGEEKRTVEGYALIFNVSSDRLDFEERIEPSALEGVIFKSDVLALLNHQTSRGILARSKGGKGSLSLMVDSKGLKYSFEAPKTALGDELLENLRRGEVNESSFAFDVAKDTWEKKSDGSWKRTISQIEQIYDVSPVYNAAYSKTSVYLRGKEAAEQALIEAEKRASEMPDTYYATIEKQFM